MNNTDLRKHCYAMGYSDDEVGAFYDGYEKGRADAIQFIEEKLLDLELFADNDYWSNNKSMMWKTEEVREILEHLKGAE